MIGHRDDNMLIGIPRNMPEWFSSKGMKMNITAFNPEKRHLRIANGKVAWLDIIYTKDHGSDRLLEGPIRMFTVRWFVRRALDHFAQGDCMFTGNQLLRAFAADPGTDRHKDRELFIMHEDREPFNFIRYGSALAVPGPSMPRQAMPSVCVELTPEMQDCVRQLAIWVPEKKHEM